MKEQSTKEICIHSSKKRKHFLAAGRVVVQLISALIRVLFKLLNIDYFTFPRYFVDWVNKINLKMKIEMWYMFGFGSRSGDRNIIDFFHK